MSILLAIALVLGTSVTLAAYTWADRQLLRRTERRIALALADHERDLERLRVERALLRSGEPDGLPVVVPTFLEAPDPDEEREGPLTLPRDPFGLGPDVLAMLPRTSRRREP